MEVTEYLADFNSSVAAAAQADDNFTVASFLDIAAERLADAQEVTDLQPSPFEGVGSSGRKLRLDGVAIDEADNSLVLLVGDHRDGTELTRLTTTDAKKHFQAVRAFVEDSVNGRLAASLEESSEAFRTAMLIKRLLPTVTRIRFYLVTNALLSERIKDFPPSKFGSTVVTYHIWDIARFMQAHLAINGREDIVIDLTEWLPEGLNCLPGGPTDDRFRTFLAVIPGAVMAAIFSRHGSRLLEGNVRSFLSTRGKVNKAMRATLAQEPHLFLAYNNGLTSTAASVEVDETSGMSRITSITDLQIVNGGQTTASLAAFDRESSLENLDGVFVQMKLVVVDAGEYASLVPNIAKYANSQNRINDADFFSNSPYHRRLEDLSRRLPAPARPGTQQETKWFYERARGQYLNEKSRRTPADKRKFEIQNPRNQVLTKTDLAKFSMSWDMRPDVVSLGAQKNFMKFADVALALWETRPDDVNESYFRALVAKGLLFQAIHKRIGEQPWYVTGYLANLTTYSVAKLASIIAEQAPGHSLNFSGLWAAQSVSEPLLAQIDLISKLVHEVLTSSNRGVQNVTEWAKKADCWVQVKALKVELSLELREELIGAADATRTKVEARSLQKLDSGIAAQMSLFAVPAATWRKIRDSPDAKAILSPDDSRVLRLMTGEVPGAVPETFQVKRLLNILAKAKEYGVISPS